jgi:MoaD family protein
MIKVKAFLSIKKAMGDERSVEFEMKDGTLKDLLNRLCEAYGQEFSDLLFDPETGDIRKINQILVNAHFYKFLPGQLETELKEGDVVSLIPPFAGG